MPAVNVEQLAEAAGPGASVEGDAGRAVARPAQIDRATADAVVFCSREGERGQRLIAETEAQVVICADDLELTGTMRGDRTLIRVSNPRLSFIRVTRRFFAEEKQAVGIHPTAIIDETASIAADVSIGPYVVIGADCEVGSGSVLASHVTLYPRSRLGSRVIIDANTSIGMEGFGFEAQESGELLKFESLGGVRIDDDVEIGANTSVDRGTLEDTVIGRGSKIDNLVHIAHNVRIGRNVVIPAGASLGGSVDIGDGAWVGIGATVLEGVRIGSNSLIGGGAVVTRDVPDGVVVAGVPAKYLRDNT